MAKKRTRSTSRRLGDSIKTMDARPTEGAARSGDLSVEYHYVIRDLGQIAIIAAVLIAGLVILSFIL